MTARQVYEAVLTELNKVQAPPLLLEDFNYFFNKAINLYVNKKYNVYDVNQQSTDDVRVLKSSTILYPFMGPAKIHPQHSKGWTDEEYDIHYPAYIDNGFKGKVRGPNGLKGATYTFNLPADYLHLLSCTVEYRVNKMTLYCNNAGDYLDWPATRLTSDVWPVIVQNAYMKPSWRRPYYIITNTNTSNFNPTNPIKNKGIDITHTSIPITGTDYSENEILNEYGSEKNNPINSIEDQKEDKGVGETTKDTDTLLDPNLTNQLLPDHIIFKLDNNDPLDDSTVIKQAGHRYGNATNVQLEIRYGWDSSVYELMSITIDYIKAPQWIRLTHEQVDLVDDKSLQMEFPDYVCQEIINELTHIIMENSSDPRLQSHPVVTLSIANPAQGLTQQTSKK